MSKQIPGRWKNNVLQRVRQFFYKMHAKQTQVTLVYGPAQLFLVEQLFSDLKQIM
jgi:hypothetical protein